MLKKFLCLCVSLFLLHNSILSMRGGRPYSYPPVMSGSSYPPFGNSIQSDHFNEICSSNAHTLFYSYTYNSEIFFCKSPLMSQREVRLACEKNQSDEKIEKSKTKDSIDQEEELPYKAMHFFVHHFSIKIQERISHLPIPLELRDLLKELWCQPHYLKLENNLKIRAGLAYLKPAMTDIGENVFANFLKEYDYLDKNMLLNSVAELLTLVEGSTNKKFWVLDKKVSLPDPIDKQLKDIPGYPVALRVLRDKAHDYSQNQAMQIKS